MPDDPDLIGAAPTQADDDAPLRATATLPARYVLGALLGAGGMGEVIAATDTHLGREVAIKRMRSEASGGATERFVREAKVQSRLDHPAIPPVHELGTDANGQPFFVMKRLAGTTLAHVIASGTATRQRLLRAFIDVCLAVELAHSRGIVHRDLKPANIMLGDYGEVYVLDWGIARILADHDEHIAPLTGEPRDTGDTEAGAILGTPGYIAPEAVTGVALDARADVYALGCILYELLTGQPLRETQLAMRAPPPDMAPELYDACVAATAREREQRPSARELAERVERFLDGDRDLAHRRTLAAGHLATARAALADNRRVDAMREAARAIAVDPKPTEAADLLGALLLEAPTEVPPQVDEKIRGMFEDLARRKAKLLFGIVCSFFLFVPVFAWMGVRDYYGPIAFCAATTISALYVLSSARRRRPISPGAVYIGAALHAITIGIVAHLFSPILLAPAMAAASVMVFVIDPRLDPRAICALMLAGVFAPWLLEITGVLERTISAVDGNLVLHSSAVFVRLPQGELALATFAIGMTIISAYTTRQIAVANHAAIRAVELQAWHLRQLVRTS